MMLQYFLLIQRASMWPVRQVKTCHVLDRCSRLGEQFHLQTTLEVTFCDPYIKQQHSI